jgi:replication fork protection complex subunit Tof1/Swi1
MFDGEENEISRSTTIDAFHDQDVLLLLLQLASGITNDWTNHDVVILEVLFHLLKGIDANKLFMDEKQLDRLKTDELKALRQKEIGMKRDYIRTAPTRHNRFGTMIWIKRDDERMSAVSGQDVLLNGQRSLAKMDESKKFNKRHTRTKKLVPTLVITPDSYSWNMQLMCGSMILICQSHSPQRRLDISVHL